MNDLIVQLDHSFPGGFRLQLTTTITERVTALVGPSGSGKSSLLAVIAGLLRPEAGHVEFGGRVLTDTKTSIFVPPERRAIAIAFQDYRVFPHLSVRSNLRFGLGRRPQRIAFTEVVDALELANLLDRYPRTLSGGQQQRVALGRALLSQPDLVLLDEPVSAVEERLKISVLRFVSEVTAPWSIPVLVATHNVVEMLRFTDSAISLCNGRTIEVSKPTVNDTPKVFNNYLMVRQIERDSTGEWKGRVGGRPILLPMSSSPPPNTTELLLEVPADNIELLASNGAESPSPQVWRGEVREVASIDGNCLIGVDVGTWLWCRLSNASNRRPNVGDTVDVRLNLGGNEVVRVVNGE